MAVGENFLYTGESYFGVGRETTYGTYATATAGLDFLSMSIKAMKDSKILQQIERRRTMSKSFSLGKVVEGDVQFYMYPELTSCAYLLQNAFGAEVTSATATGETTGGAGFTHTFDVGNFDTHTSLSVNARKGRATDGFVFEYHGGRINNLSLAAELDEPVVMNATMIFKDATQNSNDIETAFTTTALECLSFADGRFSAETAFSSLTTTSFWHVQSVNFAVNNALKNDNVARRIGTDTLDVLPYGVQSYELSCNIRFDTTTAWDAMMAATELAAEFEFEGSTMAGSVIRRGVKLTMPKVTVKDAGEPEIGGPDDTLQSTVTFNVLYSEAQGYAARAYLTNLVSGY